MDKFMNLKTMTDIVGTVETSLHAIQHEIAKLVTQCQLLGTAIGTEAMELTKRCDPMDAPEVEGADKDGDGGYARRIGQAPRE